MQVPLHRPPVRAKAQDIKHGSQYAYQDRKCRCTVCRGGHAERQHRQALGRAARLFELPESAHGRMSTYTNWYCRCDLCRDAARVYRQERRA